MNKINQLTQKLEKHLAESNSELAALNLLDCCIELLSKAKIDIQYKDVKAKQYSFDVALYIIEILQTSLPEDFLIIFEALINNCLLANLNNDIAPVDKAIKILLAIRNWG